MATTRVSSLRRLGAELFGFGAEIDADSPAAVTQRFQEAESGLLIVIGSSFVTTDS